MAPHQQQIPRLPESRTMFVPELANLQLLLTDPFEQMSEEWGVLMDLGILGLVLVTLCLIWVERAPRHN